MEGMYDIDLAPVAVRRKHRRAALETTGEEDSPPAQPGHSNNKRERRHVTRTQAQVRTSLNIQVYRGFQKKNKHTNVAILASDALLYENKKKSSDKMLPPMKIEHGPLMNL